MKEWRDPARNRMRYVQSPQYVLEQAGYSSATEVATQVRIRSWRNYAVAPFMHSLALLQPQFSPHQRRPWPQRIHQHGSETATGQLKSLTAPISALAICSLPYNWSALGGRLRASTNKCRTFLAHAAPRAVRRVKRPAALGKRVYQLGEKLRFLRSQEANFRSVCTSAPVKNSRQVHTVVGLFFGGNANRPVSLQSRARYRCCTEYFNSSGHGCFKCIREKLRRLSPLTPKLVSTEYRETSRLQQKL
jgi:hypothetical protein